MTKDLLEQARSYCAYQERCHSEVRNKLWELSFRDEDLEEALATLISEGFLDEERFAKTYCRGKFSIKHWGRTKIVRHLRQKKVSEYCIRKGLSEIDETHYKQIFEQLFQKKWQTLSKEKNIWIKRRKTLNYLLTKGFEPELFYERIKRLH